MVINQGDVYWIDFEEPSGSEPGYRHPHLVIQNNIYNRSRINTVVVCSLTSNLKRSISPGNVTLNKGEANLPKKSVVNISKIFTVNKSDLSENIGTLSKQRIAQILEGIQLLIEPREIDWGATTQQSYEDGRAVSCGLDGSWLIPTLVPSTFAGFEAARHLCRSFAPPATARMRSCAPRPLGRQKWWTLCKMNRLIIPT